MKLQHLIITASLFTSLGVMAQTNSITEASAPAPSSPQTRPMHKMHDMMMKRLTKKVGGPTLPPA
jgi:hypothetical protein